MLLNRTNNFFRKTFIDPKLWNSSECWTFIKLMTATFLSATEWSQAAGTGLNTLHIQPKSDKDAQLQWIVIWKKLDYTINQSMRCRWLMTDFLSAFAFVCALGCSVGSCPRNSLDLLIYSACVSWPSSHTHPMTKCVFHFKCSLVALDSKKKMAGSQHTQMLADPLISGYTHTHIYHWMMVGVNDI